MTPTTDSDREKRIEDVLAKWTGVRGGGPALSPRLYAGLAVDALGPVVPLERAQELERERDEARALLRRLDAWDQIRSTAPGCDGPYWRREIAAVLGPYFLPPDREE